MGVGAAYRLARNVYNLITRGRNEGRFFGEAEGHRAFWGDVCHERIRYCRNFVFSDINTLRACPWMPYSDPLRPFVRYWFSSSEGDMAPRFLPNGAGSAIRIAWRRREARASCIRISGTAMFRMAS